MLISLDSSPPLLLCVASGDILHKTVMRKTDSERAKDAASFEGSSGCFYKTLASLFWKNDGKFHSLMENYKAACFINQRTP